MSKSNMGSAWLACRWMSSTTVVLNVCQARNDSGSLTPSLTGSVTAKQRLRGKIPELKRALEGRVGEHHRFLLRVLMDQIASLEGLIARLSERIEEAMETFAEAAGRLQGIPGVGERAAEVIVAEVGTDME